MYSYFSASIILLFTSSLLYLFWYLKKTFSFFELHGVPHIRPKFLFGNTIDVILLRKSMAEVFADLYRKLEPHRFAGIYAGTKPMVLVRDPDLLKHILIKDFAYFSDRGWKVDPDVEPMSNHLFTMQNDDWKHLRIKLTNAFTTGKMKMMFPLVNACGEKLAQVIDQSSYDDDSLEIKDLWARYTTDVISSCAFGLEANSLDNPKAEFITMARMLLKFRFRSLLRILQIDIPHILIKLFNITIFDVKMQAFFGDIVCKTIDYREKNNVKRNDLLDLLIKIKSDETLSTADDEDGKDIREFLDQVGDHKEIKNDLEITEQLLAAQSFIFFFGGFETTSTNLSYVLLELSQNKSIQDKVRQEIIEVISANDGQLTYDALKQMTYTDMVIQETLRKYPSVAIMLRRTVQNYKVPDSSFVIPAGTSVIISIYGLHMDEKYYKNPHQFIPERFTKDEIAKRPNYTYLPFGEGPRYCIGARFAKMSIKVGLVYALKNYSYRISPKMKFPLEFDKNFGLLTPCNNIFLQRDRIQ